MRSFVVVSSVLLALAGCNNNPAPADTGNGAADAGHDAATVPTTDSGTDAGPGDVDAFTPPADSGCNGVLLTVHNYLAWCNVTVNGGTASAAGTQTVCVPANTAVPLVESPLTGFDLGLWHHTDGDSSGNGEMGTVAGTMSSTTEMTGAAGTTDCVWVCCPTSGASDCPATDQCN